MLRYRSLASVLGCVMGFIKALNKGQYWHETGTPGGLTPFALPNTSLGQGQENIDIYQLLAAEANKDEVTAEEKKILNSTSLIPPRTLNYSLKMMKAFTTVLKLGGETH